MKHPASTGAQEKSDSRRRISETLRVRLRSIYLGREQHADWFELKAQYLGRVVALSWRDLASKESGSLGYIYAADSKLVLSCLFADLRQWRERCQQQTPAPAKRMTAGGAR